MAVDNLLDVRTIRHSLRFFSVCVGTTVIFFYRCCDHRGCSNVTRVMQVLGDKAPVLGAMIKENTLYVGSKLVIGIKIFASTNHRSMFFVFWLLCWFEVLS